MTTRFNPLFVILTAGLLLAACGQQAGPTSSPAASAAASTAPVVSSSTVGSIKIGILEPMSGPAAVLGKDNTDAFQLYFESLGGAVAGHKLETIVADSQGRPDVLLAKAAQLVDVDKVSLLAGANFNPECYALAPFSAQRQIPVAVTGNCAGMGLTTDPKLKSPFLVRLTQTTTGLWGPLADWAYGQGLRKVIAFALDNINEPVDAFGAAFVKRGGAIVQETYPSLGTTDFGPYLAQLSPSADGILLVETGIDGLRWGQQYGQYAGDRKLQILDTVGAMSFGSNLAQAKERAVGVVAENHYTTALDNSLNKAFLDTWRRRYPDRLVSQDTAQGWATAQMIATAIQRLNGNVENKQAFMGALRSTDMDTIRGHVRLDPNGDIVQNTYVYQMVQHGSAVEPNILKVYPDIGVDWDWTQETLTRFPWGQLKGKWVGMTKEKLAALDK